MWAGTCYAGKQLDSLKEYFETRKYLGVKGLRVIAESRYDSPWQQDAQGFHYYNDPANKKSDGQYFTRQEKVAA